MTEEIPLAGGSMTAGVVRVGDTVRRPVGRWTPAVHDLLRHLESVGFAGAPRVLGFDEKGREILTYLPGDPVPNWSDEALVAVGRLVRELHDALAEYVPPAGAVWRHPPLGRRHASGPVVHGDLCPVNTAYADGVPYGFFDWDLAGPARPGFDVVSAAIGFTSIRPDPYWPRPGCPRPPDRSVRLRLFCDAYGVDDRLALLDAIEAFLSDELADTLEFGRQDVSPFGMYLDRGEDYFRRLELAWLAENRAALEAALS
jgi:hypothetical protein